MFSDLGAMVDFVVVIVLIITGAWVNFLFVLKQTPLLLLWIEPDRAIGRLR